MNAHTPPASRVVTAVAALVLSALPAFAQHRPAPALDLAAGWVGFADDGVVSEFPIGAAVRWHLSPRISIGPEVTFIAADSHSHQIVTGNLTFDLLAPRTRTPRLTPFIVVGGGLFRTSEDFAGRPPFSSIEGAFTAGGGLRAPLNDRVSAAIDARLGWEPHLRISGVISVRLGGTRESEPCDTFERCEDAAGSVRVRESPPWQPRQHVSRRLWPICGRP